MILESRTGVLLARGDSGGRVELAYRGVESGLLAADPPSTRASGESSDWPPSVPLRMAVMLAVDAAGSRPCTVSWGFNIPKDVTGVGGMEEVIDALPGDPGSLRLSMEGTLRGSELLALQCAGLPSLPPWMAVRDAFQSAFSAPFFVSAAVWRWARMREPPTAPREGICRGPLGLRFSSLFFEMGEMRCRPLI
jgi:hypothetical protein